MLRLVNVQIYEHSLEFNLLNLPNQCKIVDSSLIVSSKANFEDIFKKVMEDKFYDLHNWYIPEDFPLKFNMVTTVFYSVDDINKQDMTVYSLVEVDEENNVKGICSFNKEFLQ